MNERNRLTRYIMTGLKSHPSWTFWLVITTSKKLHKYFVLISSIAMDELFMSEYLSLSAFLVTWFHWNWPGSILHYWNKQPQIRNIGTMCRKQIIQKVIFFPKDIMNPYVLSVKFLYFCKTVKHLPLYIAIPSKYTSYDEMFQVFLLFHSSCKSIFSCVTVQSIYSIVIIIFYLKAPSRYPRSLYILKYNTEDVTEKSKIISMSKRYY